MAQLEHFLVLLEPVLFLAVAVAFFRSGAARRLPALGTYLVIRAGSEILLDWLLLIRGVPQCGTTLYTVYFCTYWLSYIADAVALFFVIQEVFGRVMEPVPGLRRLGLLVFRWVCIVSLIVAVGAVALPVARTSSGGHAALSMVGDITLAVARSIDILELCLLAFLGLSIHALGRSFRSRLFGISLGFGIQAAAELVTAALLMGSHSPELQSSANLMLQIGTTVVLLTWTAYFVIPEPATERSMIVLPPTSVMARWNSLASGIGQTPQVVAAQPSSGFFLQDIEGVVERVLAKNPVVADR